MESRKNFKKRVQAATGRELDTLPVLHAMPAQGGHVLCARRNVLIVSVGCPTREEDGVEIWHAFAQVRL